MFRRGCAKKTLQERRGKIKVMWNHEELVGRVLEANEDDHGLFVRCKLTMELQRAKEVRALMRDGAVNTMSFGFDSVKEHIENGVRVIDEIRLWEVSPVVFAANERTSIGAVRSTDFTETFDEEMTEVTGPLLMYSLQDTLAEIQWMSPDVAAVDAAIADFHARYVAWFAQWMKSDDQEEGPNELSTAAVEAFKTRDAAQISANWPITKDEAKRLLLGKTLGLEPRSRLALISPELATAHAKQRAAEVGEMFHELRAGGLTTAERTRMTALLGAEKPPAVSKLVEAVEHYVTQLTGAK
jgi:HK97 family phage prohead protease